VRSCPIQLAGYLIRDLNWLQLSSGIRSTLELTQIVKYVMVVMYRYNTRRQSELTRVI
jgi:hypothetical protein